MWLTKISVRRPISTVIIWISFFVVSLVALRKIPLDFFPPVSFPAISVVAVYPGAGPEELEKFVVEPLERSFGVIPGLKEIEATCEREIATITLTFEEDIDIDDAAEDVRTRIEFAKRFIPSDVESINVFKFSASSFPIMFLAIRGKRGADELTYLLEDIVVPRISRLDGVGGVVVFKDTEEIVDVKLDTALMSRYGVSLFDVQKAFSEYSQDNFVGNVIAGKLSFPVYVRGAIKSIQDVENLPVKVSGKTVVKLKDIAEVKMSFRKKTSATSINGENGVMFFVQKKSKANIVEVSESVKKELERVSEKLPQDVSLTVLMDFSNFIKDSLGNLTKTFFYATISVLFITFIFLRRLEDSFVVGLSIPSSILFTVFFLYILGKNINILTLSAIIMSAGLVVDNSIVVLESARRFLEMKGKEDYSERKKSAIDGTKFVFTAILGATATTLAVFFPGIFLEGIPSTFFWEIAGVIIFSVGISLFVSVTLVPTLFSLLHRGKAVKTFVRGEEMYRNLLKKVLKRPIIFSLSFSLIFVISIFVFFRMEKEFLPAEDTGDVRIWIYLPRNANYMWTRSVGEEAVRRVREKLQKYTEIEYFRWGESEVARRMRVHRGFSAENMITIGLKVKGISSKQAIELVRDDIFSIPGVEKVIFYSGNPISFFLFGREEPIEIKLFGDDIKELFSVAQKLKDELENSGLMKNTKLDISEPVPEIKLSLYDFAVFWGFSPKIIADYLETFIFGKDVAFLKAKGGKSIPIHLGLKDKVENTHVENQGENQGTGNHANPKHIDIDGIGDIRVPMQSLLGISGFRGMFQNGLETHLRGVKVSELSSLDFDFSPFFIQRYNAKRFIGIRGDSDIPAISLGEKLSEFLRDFPFPPGVDWELGGAIKEGRRSFGMILSIVGVVLFLSFASMVVTLESLTLPFVIMFSVPFAVAGGILALFVSGVPFSLMSAIGMILLMGIVVNNGIVLLDSVEKMRKRGEKDYVVEGAVIRLRPVLTTSLTTVFSFVPVLIFGGSGIETSRPLAIAVVGGMVLSTAITLFLIPSLYHILDRIKRKMGLVSTSHSSSST